MASTATPAAAAAPPAVEAAAAPPAVATFAVKETGWVANVLFSGMRLSPAQMQQVLWEPSAWECKMGKPNKLVYADADFVHPLHFVTERLASLAAFKNQKKDAAAQAKSASKISAGAAAGQGAFELGVMNKVLYSKLVTYFAALLDSAAAQQHWIVIDRIRCPSPAAELLLECALAQTASRPHVLVIDSYQRLRKFESAESARILADLDQLRGTARPIGKGARPPPASKAATPSVTIAQTYTTEEFMEIKTFAGSAKPMPCTPEQAHLVPRTQIADPRVAWGYHYTQHLFGSGSHYLICARPRASHPARRARCAGWLSASSARAH